MASVRLCSHPPNPRFFCRGPARAWSAHQDDRPQGPHRRCVQEEGLDIFAYVATSDMLPQRAGSTVRAVYAFLRECLHAVGHTSGEISHPSISSPPLPLVLNTLLFSFPIGCLNSLSDKRVSESHTTHESTRTRLERDGSGAPGSRDSLGLSHTGVLNSEHVAWLWGSIRTTVHALLHDPSYIY